MRVPSRTRLLLLLSLLLVPSLAPARLAVFVDGRVLKVDDAYLSGERIVLVLADGGRLEVPAIRIDRVIADEVEETVPLPEDGVGLDLCHPDRIEDAIPQALPFAALIERAARTAGLSPRLLAAVVEAESAFDPRAVSRAGARGLTQLMPAAAADHGVVDPFDPAESLRGGAAHLRRLLDRFETLPLALAAYNAGAATVERSGGIPPYRETRHYVRKVLSLFCGEETAPLGG